jgi:hypothetical protein
VLTSLPDRLKKCDNWLCRRKTRLYSVFCCVPCALAHDHGYEVHEYAHLSHTTMCDQRDAARGSWVDPYSPPPLPMET